MSTKEIQTINGTNIAAKSFFVALLLMGAFLLMSYGADAKESSYDKGLSILNVIPRWVDSKNLGD